MVATAALLYSPPADRGFDDEAEIDLWTPRRLSPVEVILDVLPATEEGCVVVPLLPATLADPETPLLEGRTVPRESRDPVRLASPSTCQNMDIFHNASFLHKKYTHLKIAIAMIKLGFSS